jgi:hypothetical protein
VIVQTQDNLGRTIETAHKSRRTCVLLLMRALTNSQPSFPEHHVTQQCTAGTAKAGFFDPKRQYTTLHALPAIWDSPLTFFFAVDEFATTCSNQLQTDA